ncbi:transcriptional regulatory protein YpdB [Lachnospiraceae bacterium]|nr:transcriptional regulatory protein YpdB [Lachnospiraceae bacterium]
MIRIAICDDDKKDRNRLCGLIDKYMESKKIEYYLFQFESGENFLASNCLPDVLFIDILMDGKDGIQVALEYKRINRNILIVYITNVSHKMGIAVNQVHSFGYLVKPVVEDDVFKMMDDIFQQMNVNFIEREDENIVSFVLEEKEILRLHAMDIYYFEYFDHRVKVVTKDKVYICKDKITDIAEKMEKFGFAMSHQSFVVNLFYVEKMSKTMLQMKNGAQVYLAQKRVATLKRQMMITARKLGDDGGDEG